MKKENLLVRQQKQSCNKKDEEDVRIITVVSDGWLMHPLTVHNTSIVCYTGRSYLSLLHSVVDFFVLLELLQLCLNQHLSDVHHLLHRQRQTLHRETELLLQQQQQQQQLHTAPPNGLKTTESHRRGGGGYYRVITGLLHNWRLEQRLLQVNAALTWTTQQNISCFRRHTQIITELCSFM